MQPEKVLIQAKRRDGELMPVNENSYAIWYGCKEMGIQTEFYEDIDQVVLNRETMVHGFIGSVWKALDRLGFPRPNVPDAPPALLPWFGRKMRESTLGEVRGRNHAEPLFIKPLRHQKAFNGHIVTDQLRTLILTAGFDDDFEILISEAVTFLAEYRVMIHMGMMIASRHYRGDFTLTPDYNVAIEAIRAWPDAPIGYSLDLGVTEDRTLIVEVNDAFSLGSYGTPPIMYTRMVMDRWEEMTK